MINRIKQALLEYMEQNREDHLKASRQWQNGPTEIYLYYKKNDRNSVKDEP